MSESPLMLVLSCTCGQKMKIPETATGRTFKCVRCGVHIKSSEENAAPLSPPPASDAADAPDQSNAPPAQSPIGQLLIDADMITEAQLLEALDKQKAQGGKTFELLIALGHLDKDELHDILSRQPGIATIDLSRFDIAPDLIELVPKKLAVESLVLPIDRLGKLLTVAMACPLDVATIALLERTTGLRVKAMLCKLEDIHGAVRKYYPERTRMELSPSSFDQLIGTQQGGREKVEDKLAAWEGAFLKADRLKSMTEAVAGESSLDGIVALLLEEPSLSIFLMRVGNSDIYGMPNRIETISMAVATLGKAGVLNVLEKFIEPQKDRVIEPLHPLFLKSRLTAVVAQGLAREGGAVGQHAAYSLGMLGELGRLALATLAPMKYKRIKSHLFGAELAQAEQRFFSMDHAEVAGALAVRWRFPVLLAKALRYYMKPEEAEEATVHAHLLNISIASSYTDPDALAALLTEQKELLMLLKLDTRTVIHVVGEARASAACGAEEG